MVHKSRWVRSGGGLLVTLFAVIAVMAAIGSEPASSQGDNECGYGNAAFCGDPADDLNPLTRIELGCSPVYAPGQTRGNSLTECHELFGIPRGKTPEQFADDLRKSMLHDLAAETAANYQGRIIDWLNPANKIEMQGVKSVCMMASEIPRATGTGGVGGASEYRLDELGGYCGSFCELKASVDGKTVKIELDGRPNACQRESQWLRGKIILDKYYQFDEVMKAYTGMFYSESDARGESWASRELALEPMGGAFPCSPIAHELSKVRKRLSEAVSALKRNNPDKSADQHFDTVQACLAETPDPSNPPPPGICQLAFAQKQFESIWRNLLHCEVAVRTEVVFLNSDPGIYLARYFKDSSRWYDDLDWLIDDLSLDETYANADNDPTGSSQKGDRSALFLYGPNTGNPWEGQFECSDIYEGEGTGAQRRACDKRISNYWSNKFKAGILYLAAQSHPNWDTTMKNVKLDDIHDKHIRSSLVSSSHSAIKGWAQMIQRKINNLIKEPLRELEEERNKQRQPAGGTSSVEVFPAAFAWGTLAAAFRRPRRNRRKRILSFLWPIALAVGGAQVFTFTGCGNFKLGDSYCAAHCQMAKMACERSCECSCPGHQLEQGQDDRTCPILNAAAAGRTAGVMNTANEVHRNIDAFFSQLPSAGSTTIAGGGSGNDAPFGLCPNGQPRQIEGDVDCNGVINENDALLGGGEAQAVFNGDPRNARNAGARGPATGGGAASGFAGGGRGVGQGGGAATSGPMAGLLGGDGTGGSGSDKDAAGERSGGLAQGNTGPGFEAGSAGGGRSGGYGYGYGTGDVTVDGASVQAMDDYLAKTQAASSLFEIVSKRYDKWGKGL